MSKKRMSPTEMLNSVRSKAKLGDNDFSKSIAIRLKPGKIKFQLVAADCEHLFKPRVQHMIPTVPGEDDPNEKWMIADCKREDCPVCKAANAFKKSGVASLDDINNAYNMKYPYRSIGALFTQPEHYLLCAKVLADQADDGSYLPKDSEIGSTHLIQFPRTALNNLMSAYEDYIEDNDSDADLFAILDDETEEAKSLQITCRVTNQPYSCTFAFNKVAKISKEDIDEEKLELLTTDKEVPEEHYENCVKRIRKIQNYFSGNQMREEEADRNKLIDDITEDTPFDLDDEKPAKNKVEDDDLDISDML